MWSCDAIHSKAEVSVSDLKPCLCILCLFQRLAPNDVVSVKKLLGVLCLEATCLIAHANNIENSR